MICLSGRGGESAASAAADHTDRVLGTRNANTPRQDPDGTGALVLIEFFQIPFPRQDPKQQTATSLFMCSAAGTDSLTTLRV